MIWILTGWLAVLTVALFLTTFRAAQTAKYLGHLAKAEEVAIRSLSHAIESVAVAQEIHRKEGHGVVVPTGKNWLN